jgi:hypothetical protein
MLTKARLREDLGPAGLDWITALRAPQVKALVRDGALQLSLFDRVDLAEIGHPDYPGERLVACMNPLLGVERASKRESLLAATEADLAKIAAATQRARRPLGGKDKIALRVGRVLDRRKVAKHFTIEIGDDHLSYARDTGSITGEAALDGIYVLRTSVAGGDLPVGEIVSSYKALAHVERAFRTFNTDLDIRPIRHRTEDRVRAHVFLRMLSYYITWHLQARLAPMLFRDDDKAAAETARQSPVAPRDPLPAGVEEGSHQAHPRRPASAQLPEPAPRPGHHLPQPDPARRPRPARLPARHHPHPAPAAGLRTARRQPPSRDRVVSSHTHTTPKTQVDSDTRESPQGTSV